MFSSRSDADSTRNDESRGPPPPPLPDFSSIERLLLPCVCCWMIDGFVAGVTFQILHVPFEAEKSVLTILCILKG